MSTIDTVGKYIKLKARAEHPSTPKTEAATAKSLMLGMSNEDPALPKVAKRVAGVIDGTTTERSLPNGGPGTWWSEIENFFAGAAIAAAERGADNFAGQVTGSARFEPLRRGDVALTTHDCSPNQVCLEIRVRAIDIERVSFRAKVLDGIEDELIRLVE